MTSAAITADEYREVSAFVYAEARLLDERRFDEWLALFAEDGVYWVPASPDQSSPDHALSLYYERKALLALRVARLREPSLHAHNPMVRTHHHCAAVEVSPGTETAVDYAVHASLIVAEWRNDEARWFAGRVSLKVRRSAGGLSIVMKRVDLINCDAPQRALVVPF